MLKKVGIILLSYFALMTLDSCIGCNCGDEEVIEFAEFHKLNVFTNSQNIPVNADLPLFIAMQPDSIEFIADARWNLPSLGLVTPAYGCSCIESGYGGLKYPIESIELTADKNWNGQCRSVSQFYCYSSRV